MVLSAQISGSDDLKAIISAISTVVEEATSWQIQKVLHSTMDSIIMWHFDISWPNLRLSRIVI